MSTSNDKSLYRWEAANETLLSDNEQVFIRSKYTKAGGMMFASELKKLDGLENVEVLVKVEADQQEQPHTPQSVEQDEYNRGYADGYNDATKEAHEEIHEHYRPDNE